MVQMSRASNLWVLQQILLAVPPGVPMATSNLTRVSTSQFPVPSPVQQYSGVFMPVQSSLSDEVFGTR
jgi:hypothetical protein